MTLTRHSTTESTCRVLFRPREWALLTQPRAVVGFVVTLVAVDALLAIAGVWTTALRSAELLTAAAIVMSGAICVEAMRRLGLPQGMVRDLLGTWWIPVVLLLPPVYSLIVPIPLYLLMQYRIQRAVVFRRVFSAVHGDLVRGVGRLVVRGRVLARAVGDRTAGGLIVGADGVGARVGRAVGVALGEIAIAVLGRRVLLAGGDEPAATEGRRRGRGRRIGWPGRRRRGGRGCGGR